MEIPFESPVIAGNRGKLAHQKVHLAGICTGRTAHVPGICTNF
jgi:hypothetical protein